MSDLEIDEIVVTSSFLQLCWNGSNSTDLPQIIIYRYLETNRWNSHVLNEIWNYVRKVNSLHNYLANSHSWEFMVPIREIWKSKYILACTHIRVGLDREEILSPYYLLCSDVGNVDVTTFPDHLQLVYFRKLTFATGWTKMMSWLDPATPM